MLAVRLPYLSGYNQLQIMKQRQAVPIEICILAGGRSRRMGRDKATLKLAGRSFLSRIRSAARATGLRTRVIRQDLVPGRGPVGGIHTGLKTSRSDAVVFLACDMPLITPVHILRVIKEFVRTRTNVFVRVAEQVGFPFILNAGSLPAVEAQLASQRRSLQELAKRLGARIFRAPKAWQSALTNLNTPAELRRFRATLHRGRQASPVGAGQHLAKPRSIQ